MTAPQHRAHIADRVQRLEAWAFTASADVADIKAAVEQPPAVIREEVLAYTEPVFGEIMAGRATLATKENLDDLERRLTELVETRFRTVDVKLDQRFQAVDAKLDQVLAALGKTDG
ncbi:hypothetical protein [Nonomuraea sp. SYSU D8015]|uniref:hypothetical protein n=1 Tax=Nonomuraea sp. SYSU D8015 TaxID=2593644 RepID=UPI0016603A31|nr:hypothetical protein [Nonomuraea sp. SYSU D8015]